MKILIKFLAAEFRKKALEQGSVGKRRGHGSGDED